MERIEDLRPNHRNSQYMFLKKNSNSLFAIIMFKEPQKQLIWCYVFVKLHFLQLKAQQKVVIFLMY